jgi:DNA-directed RNA polymerase subunit RPC12/RpoP
MKIIMYCWNCNEPYKKEDNELLNRVNARGIKCPKCGGYIISPSGKVLVKVIQD